MSVRPITVVFALLLLAPFAMPVPAALASSGAPAYAHYYGPGDVTKFPDEVQLVYFELAGEPSIGINRATGKAFYQHGFETFRVSFDDSTQSATWEDVTPPNSEFNIDPLLYTDEQTGRTFAGGLDGMCSVMSYTDDDGETWTPMGNACVATLDHQSIVSGPWRANARPVNALHDRAVYYCAQASFVTCMVSYDGGLTFTLPSQVTCGFSNPGFHGSLHIGPKGHAYLPFRNCGGQIGMAVSANNGQSWTGRAIPGTVTPGGGFDPDVASTPSGWVYIGFNNGTGGAYASVTKNNGTSWTTPTNVGAALGIVNSTFHEMVAGDDDRAALAFLGTTTPGDAFDPSFTGVWHLYVSHTYDGGATWATQRVTDDPVQRGWICADGTGCTTGRNLLDFMDATIDAQGRVHVAYVDGCVGACAAPGGTPAQSTSAAAVITRQVSGKTLFAAFDGAFTQLVALPGGPYTAAVGAAAPVSGAATGGSSPYSFAWSVDSSPVGSAASFAAPASATTTFTPDLAGTYTLRLTVTDATSAVASATTTLVASSAPVASAPLTDPAGDHALPGTDIREAKVVAEDATTFTVALKVDDLAAQTPSTTRVVGIPFGYDQVFSVSFSHRENATNTVRYQVSASRYAADVPGGSGLSFQLETLGAGVSGWVTSLGDVEGTWDAETDTIAWVVPKDLMAVKRAPTSASETLVLGGRTPAAGDKLTAWEADAPVWTYALVGASFLQSDTATGTGEYTFSTSE